MSAYLYEILLTGDPTPLKVAATDIYDVVDKFVDFHDDKGLALRVKKDDVAYVRRVDLPGQQK